MAVKHLTENSPDWLSLVDFDMTLVYSLCKLCLMAEHFKNI